MITGYLITESKSNDPPSKPQWRYYWLVPVRLSTRPSPSIHFGDVIEANAWTTWSETDRPRWNTERGLGTKRVLLQNAVSIPSSCSVFLLVYQLFYLFIFFRHKWMSRDTSPLNWAWLHYHLLCPRMRLWLCLQRFKRLESVSYWRANCTPFIRWAQTNSGICKVSLLLENVLMAHTMIDEDRNFCGTKVWMRVSEA